MKDKYININGICKSFRNTIACDDISFSLKKGEIYAILGESGSGKSTLLKILAGFENFDKGIFSIENNEIFSNKSFTKIENRNIGLLFQDFSLLPNLSIKKNLEIIKRQLSNDDYSMINKELSDFLDRFPHQISGGQQQRVALIRTILMYPKLVLLDEPFSKLDESTKTQIRSDFRKILKQKEISTILVTHDIGDAIEFADKIIILKDGKIIENGTYKDIIENSSNKYVASLLKHIVILNSNDFGLDEDKVFGVKPNDIILFEGNYKGKILNSIPFYNYFKIIFEYKDNILFSFSENNIQVNTEVNFKINNDKLILLN